MDIRLENIFDEKSMEIGLENGANSYSFNIDPLSPYFCQLEQIIYLIKKFHTQNNKFYFSFKNEKSFIIKNLMDEIFKESEVLKNNLIIEYSENYNVEELNDNPFNKAITFNSLSDLSKVKQIKNLHTVIICSDDLSFDSLSFKHLLKSINELSKNNVKIVLKCSWNESMWQSVLDFIPVDVISFQINNQISKSYRTIDYQVLFDNLMFYKTKFLNTKDINL